MRVSVDFALRPPEPDQPPVTIALDGLHARVVLRVAPFAPAESDRQAVAASVTRLEEAA
jgi:hypothetical protein